MTTEDEFGVAGYKITRDDSIAVGIHLQSAICKILGIRPERVRSVAIFADAGVEPVEVTVRMLMDREAVYQMASAIEEHAAGVKVVVR